MKELTKKEQKHLRETGNEFIQAVKERVDNLVFLGDVDGLGRLVAQVDIIGSYEVMKALRDKGLGKDIEALCDKAGRLDVSVQKPKGEKE